MGPPPRAAKPARHAGSSVFPPCVVEAFEACPQSAPIERDQPGVVFVVGPDAVATSGPLWQHRSLLKFLAGKDERSEIAQALWIALRAIASESDVAFEVASGALLIDVLRLAPNAPSGPDGLTRNELRDRDMAVVNAADALLEALSKHLELLPVPSTRFWPAKAIKRLRDRLYGLPAGDLSGFANLREPMPDKESPDALAWRVESDAPSVAQILVVLRDAAMTLHAARSNAPKVSQRAHHRLMRGLLRGLLVRHPSASTEALGMIVGPILATYTGDDCNDTVARAARRMKSTR